MKDRFDLLIRGGTIADGDSLDKGDIGIKDGKIAAVFKAGDGARALDCPPDCPVLDASNHHILPGVIDTQTHFREPGATHKEDIATGTAAAILGGVTSIFEMPNTNPPTTNSAALDDKCRRAVGRAWCDYAFFIGATADNLDDLAHLEQLPGCCGIKIFMGSSTGSLLLADKDAVTRAMARGKRRVSVHCEDEKRLIARRSITKSGNVGDHPHWRDPQCATAAIETLVEAARTYGRPVHVLHVNSRQEIDLLKKHRDIASFELTPQHLTLEAPSCYETWGTFAQVNPPIRDATHRLALWRGLDPSGDCIIGSDHAPHTRSEKSRDYPSSPSGMPGVQTLLPVMLDHCARGHLSIHDVVRLTSINPARLFSIADKGHIKPGFDADLAIVDLDMKHRIDDTEMASRCGWTAFHGMEVTGWPVATILRGRIAMRNGILQGTPGGSPLSFYTPSPG